MCQPRCRPWLGRKESERAWKRERESEREIGRERDRERERKREREEERKREVIPRTGDHMYGHVQSIQGRLEIQDSHRPTVLWSRGTSLVRERTPLGPYRGPLPRVLGGS
jgi:hypothetical protein